MEKQKLPNSLAVLILGILSIVGCCFYFIGLVFGIIGLVLAKKDMALYHTNPDGYDGFDNLKTGRILSIIGIVLNVIGLILIVVMFVAVGAVIFSGDQQAIQEAIQGAMGQ